MQADNSGRAGTGPAASPSEAEEPRRKSGNRTAGGRKKSRNRTPIAGARDEATPHGRVGVVDIGSNTVRLVVYDSSARGEYREGDILSGVARLVAIRTRAEEYRALLVTNADAISKARPGAGTEAKA